MFLLQFLHSFGRNILVWFAPLVFIIFSLNLNLPNTELHKQTFINNNFYKQFSQEVQKLKTNNEPLNKLASNLNDNFGNAIWLQKSTENSINGFGGWLRSDTESLKANPKPEQPKKVEQTNINQFDSTVFDEYAKKFNLSTAEVKQKFQDLQNQSSSLNNSQPLGYNLFNFPNWIKSSYQTVHKFIPFVTVVYILMLILIVLVSPLFGKNPMRELGIILSRIGSSTLFSSLVFLAGLLVTIYTAGFFQNSFLSILNTAAITSIVNWQMFWLSYSVLSTAIWIGIGSFLVSLALNRIVK